MCLLFVLDWKCFFTKFNKLSTMPVKSLLLLFRDYADRSEKRKIDKEQRIEFNILRRKEMSIKHHMFILTLLGFAVLTRGVIFTGESFFSDLLRLGELIICHTRIILHYEINLNLVSENWQTLENRETKNYKHLNNSRMGARYYARIEITIYYF